MLVDPSIFQFGGKTDEEKALLKKEEKTNQTQIEFSFPYPPDKEPFLENIFYGQKFGHLDKTNKIVVLTKCPAGLVQKLETIPGNNPTLIKGALEARELATATCEANELASKDAIAVAVSWDEKRLQTMEGVGTALKQIRQDQAQAAQKRPTGVFVKGNLPTLKHLPADDGERSRSNLQNRILDLKKTCTKRDDQIAALQEEKVPYQKRKSEILPQLEAAGDEKIYCDLKNSIDFNQGKIEQIEKRIQALNEEKAQQQTAIAEIEKQIQILNLCIDRYVLLHDRENWAKRKERTIERIHRVLSDRDSMIQLRENLNSRWKELTRDSEPLCQELALMSDAEIYIL